MSNTQQAVVHNIEKANSLLNIAFSKVSDQQIINVCSKAALAGSADLEVPLLTKPLLAYVTDIPLYLEAWRDSFRPQDLSKEFIARNEGYKKFQQRLKDVGNFSVRAQQSPDCYNIELHIS